MKYGRIVADESMNVAIHNCLEMFSAKTVRSFIKKFTALQNNQDQLKHAFRELVYGAFLKFHLVNVESERRIGTKTPDWTVINNGTPKCLIEVVTLHTNQAGKNAAIHPEAPAAPRTSPAQPDHVLRLYQSLKGKCTKYKGIVLGHGVAYVPCLFLNFDAAVQEDQVRTCLFHSDSGLFTAYPYVSGLHILTETMLSYGFRYIENPNATHPFLLPGGVVGDQFLSGGHANV